MRSRIVTAFTAMATAPATWACPVCDGGTGEQVRAGLADANLPLNLLAVALPFAVAAAVTALIHFGFPNMKKKP